MNPDEARKELACISGTIVRLYLNGYQLYQVLKIKAAIMNVVVMRKIKNFRSLNIFIEFIYIIDLY